MAQSAPATIAFRQRSGRCRSQYTQAVERRCKRQRGPGRRRLAFSLTVRRGTLVVRHRDRAGAEASVAGTIRGFGNYKINPAVSIAPALGAQAQGAVRP